MIRLILSDLDHTLLREDGSVSEETLRVLEACRAKGIRFAIATARYWIGAERYIALLRPDYEITTDGTLVHAGGERIYSCAFSAGETNAIVQRIRQAAPEAEITVACGKTVYWNSERIAQSEKLHKAVYCDYASPLEIRANKIVAELPDESLARAIAAAARCKLQCYRGEQWYAFIPADSGKIAAIRALARACGVGLGDIVAFGDDLNDIDMLKLCGVGVAVANAVPEVRGAADEIARSNEEDGVARWLSERLLMEERGL